MKRESIIRLVKRYSSDDRVLDAVLTKGTSLFESLDAEDPLADFHVLLLVTLEELQRLRQEQGLGPSLGPRLNHEIQKTLRTAWQQLLLYNSIALLASLLIGFLLGRWTTFFA